MKGRPLAGITVVAMEQALAIPFATRQLADLGARVIKIERPGSGDFAREYDSTVSGLSSAFVWLNRGKESIECDVKSPQGRRVLDALLDRADVFVHNISPGAAGRLGLDSPTLSAAFPRLISGSVSGYGPTGPMAGSKAYDLLVQGETGVISLSGSDAEPAKVGISIADISAGMYAYSAILAALYHRQSTGEVLPVDVSLFDSLTEWLGYPLLYTLHSGSAPQRAGTSHATIAPYGVYKSADGDQVLLAVQNNREWARFCDQVLQRPEIALELRFTNPADRVRHRLELDTIINAILGHLDRATILERLETASIANARFNTIADLAEHEQLVSRGRWITTGSEVGPLRTLLPPWVPAGHDLLYGDVPALGADTAQILQWLGLREDALTDLTPEGEPA